MCLAVPGRVESVSGDGLGRKGRVGFGPVFKEVNLSFVPEARVGCWVVVHAGFAISVLDEDEARKVLAFFDPVYQAPPTGGAFSRDSAPRVESGGAAGIGSTSSPSRAKSREPAGLHEIRPPEKAERTCEENEEAFQDH